MAAEPGQLWNGNITFERDTSRDAYESGGGVTKPDLYAWTDDTSNLTFWTDLKLISSSSSIYDSSGNDVTSTYIDGSNSYFNSMNETRISIYHKSTALWPISTTSVGSGTKYYCRDYQKDILSPKPRLYAYRNPNPNVTTLYAWTYEDCTVYTRSATPSSGDDYYDSDGINITGSLTVTGNDFGNCTIDYYGDNTIKIDGEPMGPGTGSGGFVK